MIRFLDSRCTVPTDTESSCGDRSRFVVASIGLSLAVLIGCERAPDTRAAPARTETEKAEGSPFQGNSILADITSESGLQFRHRVGGRDPFFMPLSIGSGVALLDYDDDDRLDIYLIHDAGPGSGAKNQLFHQNSRGSFDNVSDGSGLDVDGYGMGVAVGDVNNDGKVDLVVTDYARVRLYVNDSKGTQPKFIDATQASGLENPSWATSASFVDYDRDGWLDLIVVNYVDYDPTRRCSDAGGRLDFCGPRAFGPLVARLFRNRSADVANDENELEGRGPFRGCYADLRTRQPTEHRTGGLLWGFQCGPLAGLSCGERCSAEPSLDQPAGWDFH